MYPEQGATLIRKIISLSLLFLALFMPSSTNAMKAPVQEDIAVRVEQIEPYSILKEEEKEQKALAFQRGNWEGYFGGFMRIEYYLYNHLDYLNMRIPDQLGVFKHTIDLLFDLIYGKKKYGHDAFEFFVDLRTKGKWGDDLGNYKNTTPVELTYLDTSLGEHDHRTTRPTPWFKDAWFKFSLNAVCNSKLEEIQYVQIGWFPFLLGRGISLGASYATAYEELGLFSYPEDMSAPGIDIFGELVKNKLWYDLYYAKFQDNTTRLLAAFNDAKKYHVGRRYHPWSGIGKDDELWAMRLYWTAFDNKKVGRLDLEPYIFFNEASDQRVEFRKDTKTQLGSYGLGAEYSYKNFAMGAEVAFNFGTEKLYWVDRNRAVPAVDSNGFMYEKYNNVSTTQPDGYLNLTPAKVTPDTKQRVLASHIYDNGDRIDNLGGDPEHPEIPTLYNASYRYRPEYKNHLHGWMGVVDAEYKIENWDLKLGTEFLYATGDYDPNEPGDFKIEKNKKYRGFIGLHEIYNGYRIRSGAIFGERELGIPTSLRPGLFEYNDGYYANTNTAITDVIYLGFSATYTPRQLKNRNCKINPNLICYWKEHESYKYIVDVKNPNLSHTSEKEKARKYLGTEANIMTSIDLIRDLSLTTVVSAFFPGGFFSDVKGVPTAGDYYRNVLGAPNPEVLPKANPYYYRIGDDTALFVDIALNYSF